MVRLKANDPKFLLSRAPGIRSQEDGHVNRRVTSPPQGSGDTEQDRTSGFAWSEGGLGKATQRDECWGGGMPGGEGPSPSGKVGKPDRGRTHQPSVFVGTRTTCLRFSVLTPRFI